MKLDEWNEYALSRVDLEVDESGFPKVPPMTAGDIVERIMTQHWDMAACRCWVCTAGNAAGCRANAHHVEHYPGVVRLPKVHVPIIPRPQPPVVETPAERAAFLRRAASRLRADRDLRTAMELEALASQIETGKTEKLSHPAETIDPC